MITLFHDVRSLLIHIVGNVEFLPDNRLDSVRSEHRHERMRTVHIAMVGDCHRIHSARFQSVAKRVRLYRLFGVVRIGHDLQKSHRTVKKTVFGM